MSSRSALKGALAVLAVLVLALAWFLRAKAERPPVVASLSTPAPAEPPAPVRPSLVPLGEPLQAGGERVSAPVVVSGPKSEPKPAPPAEEPVELPLLLPPGASIEKPTSLEPLTADSAAIAASFQGSSYETRFERLRVLEAALGLGLPDDESQREAFAALKAELVWLRDNLGQPPR